MAYDVLHDFPPSLREIRLGGFGMLDIFRIGYFGLILTWCIKHARITVRSYLHCNIYQTCYLFIYCVSYNQSLTILAFIYQLSHFYLRPRTSCALSTMKFTYCKNLLLNSYHIYTRTYINVTKTIRGVATLRIVEM